VETGGKNAESQVHIAKALYCRSALAFCVLHFFEKPNCRNTIELSLRRTLVRLYRYAALFTCYKKPPMVIPYKCATQQLVPWNTSAGCQRKSLMSIPHQAFKNSTVSLIND
jgi:hypothetical protein